MDFPKTITRELLVEKGACEEGLKAFDAAYPPGSVRYSKSVHRRWFRENPSFEAWAVEEKVCAPLDSRAGGFGGTATAGYEGTATAGDGGTATAGFEGTATAGYRGTATAGFEGTATAGYRGTAQAGKGGTATAGRRGTATAGDYGKATAGDYGKAQAGYVGTATAGRHGTAQAGKGGILRIAYWDSRQRWATAYVGEDGILPGIPYTLDGSRNFVLVQP